MTIKQFFESNYSSLKKVGITTPKLDIEVLLSDILNKDRSWVLAHPEFELSVSQIEKLDIQIARRQNHEPIAYIREKQEFYGRDFLVTPDTLTPRPETETMIEMLKNLINNELSKLDKDMEIIDVGTGSGCIIITSALELPKISNIKYQISFTGLDISESALKIAQKNARKYKAPVKFKKFDLKKNIFSSFFSYQISNIVLANLPYVPADFHINLSASHEPDFAIFGGSDGLDLYRSLFSKLENTRYVLTESMPPQHDELNKIAEKFEYKQINRQDFIQVFERI